MGRSRVGKSGFSKPSSSSVYWMLYAVPWCDWVEPKICDVTMREVGVCDRSWSMAKVGWCVVEVWCHEVRIPLRDTSVDYFP